jgi:hypothetical protein
VQMWQQGSAFAAERAEHVGHVLARPSRTEKRQQGEHAEQPSLCGIALGAEAAHRPMQPLCDHINAIIGRIQVRDPFPTGGGGSPFPSGLQTQPTGTSSATQGRVACEGDGADPDQQPVVVESAPEQVGEVRFPHPGSTRDARIIGTRVQPVPPYTGVDMQRLCELQVREASAQFTDLDAVCR